LGFTNAQNGYDLQKTYWLGLLILQQTLGSTIQMPAVTIMFDDGFAEVYNEAFPLMEKFGYPSNVALSGSKIGKKGYLTIEQTKFLLSKNWCLSDHSFSHVRFKNLNSKIIEKEIMANREFVEKAFNYEFTDFVFPQSKVSPHSLSDVLSYYPVAFTGTSKVTGNLFPFQSNLLTRVEISTYEVLLNGFSSSVFMGKVDSYLKALSEQNRKEWIVFFTHKIKNRPGLFDASNKQFSDLLNSIKNANISVKTTDTVIQEITNR
jgi:peptidoglycan/xylan/chitin deacetylase (PgdA/CDA1 family)